MRVICLRKRKAFEMLLNRREFLKLGAGALAAAGTGCANSRANGAKYSVLVLGDVHFDAPEIGVYHAHYKPTTGKAAEIFPLRMKREHDQWSGLMQRLAAAARRDIRPDTKFVLQLGDLIQGNCAKAAVHAKMLEDGFAYFKKTVSPDLPFVPVVGNHDVDKSLWLDKKTSLDVFRETMFPKWTRELGQSVDNTTFAFRQGPDLFVYADFNYPDPERILNLLEDNANVRHTFLVSHGAVVPVGPGAHFRWFLLGKKELEAVRRKLFSVLCQRHAIALVGHNHVTSFADLKTPEGRLTQFMATSVWSAVGQADKPPKYTSPTDYARLPKKSKDYDLADARALFGEYRPHVKDFFFSGQQGRFMLDVSDTSVTMTAYGGDRADAARVFVLRGQATARA